MGRELKHNSGTIIGYPLPKRATFGIRCLSANEDLDLEKALERPIEPELYEELLADAQTAIFEGNFRRGALEMAIGCEVAVKQVFFAKSSIAGEAYEYLESKQKVSVSIPELIDGAAKQAFGESFKITNPKAFDSIAYMFQCRNKIAHHGEAWYRDNNKNATQHVLDRDILSTWWKAVDDLLIWLVNHTQR